MKRRCSAFATTSHVPSSGAIAEASTCSNVCSSPTVAWSTQCPARFRTRMRTIPDDGDAVDEDVAYADRDLMRLLERRHVGDGRRIEHHNVGEHPGAQYAAVVDVQTRGNGR